MWSDSEASHVGNTGEQHYRIPELLEVKRDGEEWTEQQINVLIKAISEGYLEDVQLGAFLMSVYINGLTKRETTVLTKAMTNSGMVWKWPSDWCVVDKHSTGGVGDKVSLILAPALASLGLKVPMISGRGLAHTGGTLDKLESIPGFKVSMKEEEVRKTLESVGCCIVGQTSSIVPADKRMYAARDVTATVPSTPLIVSSIIGKKASESLNSLVLDVKFGSGSFMKTQREAEALAEALVSNSNSLGIHTSALVTSMDSPLGKKIGNALEVEEALQCLKGGGPQDLIELVLNLGAELFMSTNKCKTIEEGMHKLEKSLKDGSALKKFREMIEAQGVSKGIADELCGANSDFKCLPKSKFSTTLLSEKTGIIECIDAMTIAEVCLEIGAGRYKSSDQINHAVGVVLLKKDGEEICESDPWIEIRHDKLLEERLIRKIKEALKTSPSRGAETPRPLILKRIAENTKAT